jgi:hypothetical protein
VPAFDLFYDFTHRGGLRIARKGDASMTAGLRKDEAVSRERLDDLHQVIAGDAERVSDFIDG